MNIANTFLVIMLIFVFFYLYLLLFFCVCSFINAALEKNKSVCWQEEKIIIIFTQPLRSGRDMTQGQFLSGV